jgi:hypothetical protein
MKRDIDLIRLLLLQAEDNEEAREELKRYDQKEVMYNAALLVDQGLALGAVMRHGFHEVVRADIDCLTWEGHDFLDAARDNTLWRKAKEKVMKPGAAFTFEIVKEFLKAEVRSHLGLSS